MTSCTTIMTGDLFLSRVLTYIDCEARNLGNDGYLALAQPGSLAGLVVNAALIFFVGVFGLRLMFGRPLGVRDMVFDIARIGLVLTLAFSWPAFRTVIYDVVIDGPFEVLEAVSGQSDSGTTGLVDRLQAMDSGIVDLIEKGMGRNEGKTIEGRPSGANFAGTSLQDEAALGWARLLFLSGTIASVGFLRSSAGILLALAPLFASTLLFDATRGIFAGWAKGLAFVFAGIVAISLFAFLQLGLVEPWMKNALQLRALGYATPTVPIELFAMTLASLVIQLGSLWLFSKIIFNASWSAHWRPGGSNRTGETEEKQVSVPIRMEGRSQENPPRILGIADAIHRRERDWIAMNSVGGSSQTPGSQGADDRKSVSGMSWQDTNVRLGSSFRRTVRRYSSAAQNRDNV
jgi:type IV secretion system protein VirB6